METKKSKFDGLVVKFNNKAITGCSDCQMCCLNCDNVGGCPLLSHYYFALPEISSKEFSGMSVADKEKLQYIIKDLSWLAKSLDDGIRLRVVFESTISMAKSFLERHLFELGTIRTFDK